MSPHMRYKKKNTLDSVMDRVQPPLATSFRCLPIIYKMGERGIYNKYESMIGTSVAEKLK